MKLSVSQLTNNKISNRVKFPKLTTASKAIGDSSCMAHLVTLLYVWVAISSIVTLLVNINRDTIICYYLILTGAMPFGGPGISKQGNTESETAIPTFIWVKYFQLVRVSL